MLEDTLARLWENIGGRIGGPLSFRVLLQPTVASVLAARAGLADARAVRSPYFWTILTSPADRKELLREGWKSVANVFLFAIAMDTVYQLIVFRWVYPFELVLVAFVLACVPYLLLRGLVNRITSGGRRRAHR